MIDEYYDDEVMRQFEACMAKAEKSNHIRFLDHIETIIGNDEPLSKREKTLLSRIYFELYPAPSDEEE